MSQERRCPQCGAELPANTPQGLCPACLLEHGLDSHRSAEDSPSASQGSPAPSGFSPPLAADLAPHFPNLEILELLGQGGMGAVYKARQPGLDRLVALKVLPPGIGYDAAFAERFKREARSLARLNHPNIVAVYDFGEAAGLYYFVMEYVDGVNLRQMERAERPSPKQALGIVMQVCEALQYAHDEGIVHRDIKPENILLDKKGRVKIADFGLAKLLARTPADFTLTQPQQVMGTPHYMAPEQFEHPADVDQRADIYSLGVVFYEMLTGELPLGRFAPPSQKFQVDVRLDEVVLKTLEKEPSRRYQHASEVKTDVEEISRGPQAAAAPTTPAPAPGGRKHGEANGGIRESSIRAAGDGLIVMAGVALLVAAGVGLWLRFAAEGWDLSMEWPPSSRQSRLCFALAAMAAISAVYALFIGTAGILMRRVRGRLYAVLSAVIMGVFIPAVLALNVIMEYNNMGKEWMVLIPLWLGMPICIWLTTTLFRRDSRVMFENAARAEEKAPPDGDQGRVQDQPAAGVKADADAASEEPGPAKVPAAPRLGKGRRTGPAWIVAGVIVGALLLLAAIPIVGGLAAWLLVSRPMGVPLMEPAEELDLGGGVRMKMVLIPAGKFMMGSPDSEKGRMVHEGPQHEVTISKPFYMGVTEVTQAQYQAIMGTNPSNFEGEKNPVDKVSWNDATEFCKKLSEKTGQAVRLPTEAEWEYACRAGSKTRFCFGDADADLGDYAWSEANSGGTTHPVGQKEPNAWGLYDMHGNLCEWCADWYGDYPNGTVTDPQGPASGTYRVLRGGCWLTAPSVDRSALRILDPPSKRTSIYGFRVVVSVPGSPAAAAPAHEQAFPVVSQWQKDSADKVGLPLAKELDLGGGVTVKMVFIPAGKFMMGEEKDRHEVTISKPFYLSVTEVTQAQYQAVMGTNPSHFKGATNPVEMVSWHDATEFCKKLSEKTRQAVRLTTEAEWEYACRAGTQTAFSFGDDPSALGDYVWWTGNSGGTTHPVGQKKPNARGLYDMHGNVWEWCADWYEAYPAGPATDPSGPATGSGTRVVRGGAWDDVVTVAFRCEYRFGSAPSLRCNCNGFRCAMTLP